MKNNAFALFFLLVFFCLPAKHHAQQSALRGVITVQNSQFDKGKLDYIQFAEVDECSQPRKGHALTDAQGQWRMEIVGIAEKDPVFLKVKKEGWQVVNTDALQAAAGQSASVRLYMATNKYITDAKRRYYNTGYTEAEKNLTKKLNAKTEELIALQKQTNADQQKINALQEETALLQSQYEKLDQFAHDLADKYARINLDDAGQLYQDAFRLFQAGDLEGAMQLWRNADLSGQVNDILEEEKRLSALKKEVVERDSVKTRRKEDLMQNLRLKADAHRLRFEWDSVGATYAELIRLDSTDYDNLFDCLVFLAEQHQYTSIIHLAEKALSFIEDLEQRGEVLAILSLSYAGTAQMQRTEQAFLELERVSRKLAEQNPDIFLPDLAADLQNLGSNYDGIMQPQKAEKAYKESVDIYRKLAEKAPQTFMPDLAQALLAAGDFYLQQDKMNDAEKSFLEADLICRNLTKQDTSHASWVALSQTLCSLGNFYFQNDSGEKSLMEYLSDLVLSDNKNRSDKKNSPAKKSLLSYQEAEEIANKIASQNPDTLMSEVGAILMRIGDFYFENGLAPQAERSFKESLRIYRLLAQQNNNDYLPELANNLKSLGSTYSFGPIYTKENSTPEEEKIYVKKAEEAYIEAADIYRKLALQNPSAFLPALAEILSGLAGCYESAAKMAEAENAYAESTNIYRKLADKNPKVFQIYFAESLTSLAEIYENNEKKEDAEKAYIEAVSVSREFAVKSPEAVQQQFLAINISFLAQFYQNNQKETEAEKAYSEALDIYLKSTPFEQELAAWGLLEIGDFFLSKQPLNTEKAFLKALELYKELAEQSPEEYFEVVSLLAKLESLYIATDKKEDAKKARAKASNITEELLEQDAEDYLADLTDVLKDFGERFTAAQQFEKALKCLGEAISICESNAKTNRVLDGFFSIWRSVVGQVGFLRDTSAQQQRYDIAARATRLLAESNERMQRIEPRLIAEASNQYGSLSWYQLFTRQYPEAAQAAEKSLSLDPTQNWVRTNLGHSHLFRGNWEKAQQVYAEYLKNEKDLAAAKNILLKDWDDLEKAGVTHQDVAKARAWLKE